jgi:hypothetical protein
MLRRVGFFDAARVPPPPPPPSYRLPDWLAPPENVEPVAHDLRVVLARTPQTTLTVPALGVSGAGVTIELAGSGSAGGTAHPLFGGAPIVDGGLAFGVLFADGRTAIAGGLPRPLLRRPDAAVLRVVSGGGDRGRFHAKLWLWPLPPAGPLELVCEWRAEDVAETGATIDFAPLHASAAHAVELWPDDRDPPPTEGDVVI